MAKIIVLSGDVGWEITAKAIRSELAAAKGKDVEFHVNSPGGFVSEALEIFNLVRGYKGKTEMRIVGFAASAMSYIVLAADKVTAHENAVYMIHNAWNLAIGDHHDMRKVAATLESLSNIMAKAYAKKADRELDVIKSFMDNDSYFFGDEMETEGFVDEMIEAEDGDDDGDDKDSAVIKARASMTACLNRMRNSDAANADMDRAVAYMDGMAALIDPPAPPKIETPAAASGDDDPAGAGKKKQEDKDMTFEEYLAANPAAQATYDAAIAKARGEGIAEVRASIKATVEKVSPILSSEAYDKHTKDLGVAAITGEKSIDAFDAMVAVVDRENEKAKEAAAKAEGDKETPPTGPITDEEKAAAELEARKKRLNVGEV